MLNVAQKALLVNDKGEVLVMKSSDPDGNGNYWDFPGGRMEIGETPLQTLEREINEETGMTVDVTDATLFHVGWYKGFGKNANEDVYKTFWIVNVPASSAILSWEHSDALWLDPQGEVPNDFVGPYREILDRYCELTA